MSHFSLPSFERRWLRRGARTVGGVLALWLLAWLWVPSLVRQQLEHAASEQLGRRVTVGQVDFAPWALQMHLRDLAVATADGSAEQLRIAHIYIDAELQSLWRLAPVADAVEVEGVRLRLARLPDGSYDIDDIRARLASRPAAPASSEPLHYALYNIALRGADVDFDDRLVGRTHALRRAELTLPFLSNLAAYREVKVEPHIAFELNGTAFESNAVATPFAVSRKTAARLRMDGFDLTPFAGYLPQGLPVRFKSGRLDADLRMEFEQAKIPSVQVRGTLGLREVAVVDGAERELLGFDGLHLVLADIRPLEKMADIASLRWEGVRAQVRRSAAGTLELLSGWPEGASSPRQTQSEPVAPPTETGASWAVTLRQAHLQATKIDWIDAAMGGTPAHLSARNLDLRGADIAWPLQRPLKFHGSTQLGGTDSTPVTARVSFSGEATDRQATVAASIRQLPLELAQPYLKSVFAAGARGVLEADLGIAWNGPVRVAKAARLRVEDIVLACPARQPCLSLQDAAVAPGGTGRVADLHRLEISDAMVNLARRSVDVGRIVLDQPRVAVARGADGRWMFEGWLRTAGGTSAAPVKRVVAAPTAPWAVQVREALVEGGAVGLRDLSQARPVSVNLSDLQIRAKDLWSMAAQAAASPLAVSARITAGRFEPGRVSYEGTLGIAPLAVQGRVQATRVPLQALEPYFGDRLNVSIVRAQASFSGEVRHQPLAAPGGGTLVRGDLSLDDVRVRSVDLTRPAANSSSPAAGRWRAGEELLNWKSLAMRGFSLDSGPGRPLAVDVKETSLSDFFARIIVQENGRINLQDIGRRSSSDTPTSSQQASAGGSSQEQSLGAPDAAAPAPTADGGSRGAPVVRFGPITLTGGAVRFTDLFIKPNYSADISQLAGRLGAFSSEPPQAGAAPQMAALELRGRAEGTASLEIVGQLNPLAKPLALDIQGRMRDLELPPLSPYSIKYAGHGIERGKLSMDVTYRVLPDGQLTASNKLVLHQLAFGEPVQGAPASLPVRLAVALLADREGVIDVDLPISGSLNDPEFRLGSVILRVIGNLIMKAVTAPFALLAGAFEGADEMSSVEFAAGSAVLDAKARDGLDKVARALADRPALKMTVVGEARLEAEREAWKNARLQSMLQAQKRRLAIRAGQAEADAAPATAAEYPALLKELYRRTDMDKPRNVFGLAKDLPDAEMEALLLAQMTVSDAAMRELALARSVAVRDYLAQRGVLLERLFVGAARTGAPVDGWQPHAELSLATR